VTATDAIRTCVENAERQVRMFSQRVQWPPLLLEISTPCGPRLILDLHNLERI